MLAAVLAAAVAMSLVVAGSAAGQTAAGDSEAAIAITEQASDQILVLASDDDAWSKAQVTWRWRPTAANGFEDLVDNWGLPDEAKLRHRGNQAYLLTTDSYGLAAVVPYPQGTGSYWAADVGRPANPHSIELRMTGRPGQPRLTEVRRVALPTLWGHDLQPVASDDDRFWITTGSQVYQYSYARNAFLQDFPGASVIQVGVKSVGDERASGQLLASLVQVGNICTWCTDTVSLFESDGSLMLHGAQIYKARWWVDPNAD